MVRSDLFGEFLTAVSQKGFFDGTTPPTISTFDHDDANQINTAQKKYEERYRKVVAKFRTKLAAKAAATAEAGGVASGGDRGGGLSVISGVSEGVGGAGSRSVVSTAAAVDVAKTAAMGADVVAVSAMVGTAAAAVAPVTEHNCDSIRADPTNAAATAAVPGSTITDTTFNQTDLDEAEKLKSAGNAHMQKKEYEQAVDAYTSALKLCPSRPSSHVYFSNRAAPLLSMKSFEEAIRDSERSLALKPDYAKAHARLGLAQFLLGRFEEAVKAYEWHCALILTTRPLEATWRRPGRSLLLNKGQKK